MKKETTVKCLDCGNDFICSNGNNTFCGSIKDKVGCVYKRQKNRAVEFNKTYDKSEKKQSYFKQYFEKRKNTVSYRYNTYKTSSKAAGKTFDLTMDDFRSFWNEPCSYCGSDINGIGLDRVDSSIGYILSNVIPCCSMCNYMKRHHDRELFLNHIEKIHDHMLEVN